MDEGNRPMRAGHEDDAALDPSDDVATPAPSSADGSDTATDYDESLFEELGALIDDGRNYAAAEIAFQKTRAKLAGKSVGLIAAFVIVALILLHIAFLALAVGLVIALAPLVTIWGAIGIVVGGLLLLTAFLGYKAMKRGKQLGEMFSSGDSA